MDEIAVVEELCRLDQAINTMQLSINLAEKNGSKSTRNILDLLGLLSERYQLTMIDEDLERGIRLGTTTLHYMSAAEPDRVRILSALAKLLGLRYDCHGTMEDLDSAISLIDESLSLSPQDLLFESSLQHNLGLLLMEKYNATKDATFMEQSIQACKAALGLIEPSHPDVVELLCMAALGLETRFELNNDMDALQNALEILEMAVEITPHDDPARLEQLISLGSCLERRYETSGAVVELDNLVRVFEETEKLTRIANVQHLSTLNSLARWLKERYWSKGQSVEDLARAIAISEEALSIAPESLNAMMNLESVLLLQFHGFGDRTDLDRCIQLAETAYNLVGPRDPDRARISHAIARISAERFHCIGELTDLEKAAKASREAVESVAEDDPSRFKMMMGLAEYLGNQFLHSNQENQPFEPRILDEAIRLGERVLAEAPQNDASRPIWLAAHGVRLKDRFRAQNEIGDLDEAVRLTSQATVLVPTVHYAAAHSYSSHALCLRERYILTGNLHDIDYAIEMADKAVKITQKHAGIMAERLTTLAICLVDRFATTGALADLNHGIEAIESAVQTTPRGSIHRPLRIQRLSSWYALRYRVVPRLEDLEHAIQSITAVLDEVPNYRPEKPVIMSTLASQIHHRALAGGKDSEDDHHKAVQLYEKILELLPQSDRARPAIMAEFGTVLLGRFIHGGMADDINRSIGVLYEAIGAMTVEQVLHVSALHQLGTCHVARYAFSENPSPMDLEQALQAFTACFKRQQGDHTVRIQGAMAASDVLTFLSRTQEAYQILKEAVDSLPLITSRSLPQPDHQYRLKSVAGLASRVTSAALAAVASFPDVMMLLERSRGIITSFLMDAHSDLSMLDAKVSSRFLRAREKLNALSLSFDHSHHSTDENLERSSYLLRSKAQKKAEQELMVIIQQIQDNPETREFLRPPSEIEVMEVIENDFVVLVNADHARCDAFVLDKAHGTRLVELTKLDVLQVRARSDHLASSRPYIDPCLLEWLWETMARPILEMLGLCLPPPDGRSFPRIVWIMTGSVHRLPIHAARRHADGSGNTVMDRAMSSYSSSLRSFVHGRKKLLEISKDRRSHRALLVGIGKSQCRPDLAYLPFAVREIDRLQRLGPELGLEPVRLEAQTCEALLKDIASSVFFHFAGHGSSEPLDPSRSGLLLEDGLLTVADLQERNTSSRPIFLLSYLSACLTGANDATGLEDESIHLIGAFQLAGFRHVIGTLWQVFDESCLPIAESFYRYIAATAAFTDKGVCAALHDAVKRARDTWVHRKPSAVDNTRPAETGAHKSQDTRMLASVLDSLRRPNRTRDACPIGNTKAMKVVKAEWVPYVHYGP